MNLQQLCSVPHATVSYDTWNNWLFIDWEGNLTLPAVQRACLELARCCLTHHYPRVLNCNSLVTGVDWPVVPWLMEVFFPHLPLTGVRQLAWVYAPEVRSRNMAEHLFQRLPPSLDVALFNDVEHAVTWLEQTRPDYSSGCAWPLRSVAAAAKLQHIVKAFDQFVSKQLPLQVN